MRFIQEDRLECSWNPAVVSRSLGARRRGECRDPLAAARGVAVLALFLVAGAENAAVEPSAGPNSTSVENARPGVRDWGLTNPATQREIEGYASMTSVAPGEGVSLHVSAKSHLFDIDVYRLGWYGGAGARRVAQARAVAGGRRTAPQPRASGRLIACAWSLSYTIAVPAHCGNG